MKNRIALLRFILILSFCVLPLSLFSQANGVTHAGRNTGQPMFPKKEYKELPNPVAVNPALWNKVNGVNVRWGSVDERYAKEIPPTVLGSNTIELTAWKGERVAAQFVVYGKENLEHVSFEVSDLINGKERIGQGSLLKGFVRYVMTDELNKDKKGACGQRPDATRWDSSLVADPIDHFAKELAVPAMNTQPAWVRIWVPQDIKSGVYSGTVTVKDGNRMLGKLNLKVNVKNRVLPKVDDWAFHLDLWQNPYAVARYYQVEPWSKEHFDAMRPIMELYHQAGGKVITTSIMHKPWNGQTYDYFESMVTWMKKLDGTWSFDFSVFDKWVEFMMSIGIKKEIGCYSMVPWALSFQYFDQASNTMKFVKTQPGEAAYDEMWTAMLTAFAKHLKEKGWFEITHISMDERPIDIMLKTLKVIRKADPKFKISMAGNLYQELLSELDDYCIPLRLKYSKQDIEKRRAEGKVTTFYTCCAEPYPNTFTFSAPAEAEWLGLYAAMADLDGYLRWAYNSWVLEPLLDSRFITWAAGDTYMVYPEGRTCIRFERLVAGIQDYEKIRILRNEYKQKGNISALKNLERALSTFDELKLNEIPASRYVNKVKAEINKF